MNNRPALRRIRGKRRGAYPVKKKGPYSGFEIKVKPVKEDQ
jgi:hypothetical protein